jgi:hypothetical protein
MAILGEILARAPVWVWALLVVLVAVGVAQARPRNASLAAVVALPASMIALSAYSVLSTFQPPAPALLAWLAGLALAVAGNRFIRYPRGAVYLPQTARFALKGSWLPLALILAIIIARFIVTAAATRDPSLRGSQIFGEAAGLAYGVLGGQFLAGALSLWRMAAPRSPLQGA